MTEQQKLWIDTASHEQLLRRWRFMRVGDPFFQGDTGEYYVKVLAEKRATDPAGHVRASKRIGW